MIGEVGGAMPFVDSQTLNAWDAGLAWLEPRSVEFGEAVGHSW